MEITLGLVRQVLRECLGFESFVARFISRIIETDRVSTASITEDGTLSVNPKFLRKYIKGRDELFCLVFHEILHPLFCHFIYGSSKQEAIACDAVINAVISGTYSEHSKCGILFKKVYSETGIEGLLRPRSNLWNTRYSDAYNRLYAHGCGKRLTAAELIQILKVFADAESRLTIEKIIVLGSHDEENKQAQESKESAKKLAGKNNPGDAPDAMQGPIPTKILTGIAEEIWLKLPGGSMAGYCLELFSIFKQILKSNFSVKSLLLEKYTTERKMDKIRTFHRHNRLSISPVPINPSKRDLVLLACGIYPGYFHNRTIHNQFKDKGIAIYLDVSGSVNESLPDILGILMNLKGEISTVFQFSNKAVETAFETLLSGNVQTTGGTDFNCVASSMLEKEFDRAIVFTDGYASLDPDLAEELHRKEAMILTVLFGNGHSCDDLRCFGDVIRLEDAVE